MRLILNLFFTLLSFCSIAQTNFVTVGYGLNIGDEKIFRERQHSISVNNLAAKISYSKSVSNFLRCKVDIGFSDYDVINQTLDPNNPEPVVKPYRRVSTSLGPQFKLFEKNNFTFLSGFNAGYHFGSDASVESDFYKASYFDFAINPLSISYSIKDFTIDFDSYIGSNMYSNLFIGLGYTF